MKPDKFKHVVMGVTIAIAVACILSSPFIGFLAATLAGAGKEVHDYLRKDKHTPDVFDALYTLAGAGCGAGVAWGLIALGASSAAMYALAALALLVAFATWRAP